MSLRQQLSEEKALRLKAQSQSRPPLPQKQTREIGTNTDKDYLAEELSLVKQALLRHTSLNKELLSRASAENQ